jgi:hypothetical protein
LFSVDPCSLVRSRVRRSCSFDDSLWMDYATGIAPAPTRSVAFTVDKAGPIVGASQLLSTNAAGTSLPGVRAISPLRAAVQSPAAPKVLVATSGSRGPLRDVAAPAPCGGSPAHSAATELPIPDVPTEATASAVRPAPVDAQLIQLTSAPLPVGGVFSSVPSKGPGSFLDGVHGPPGSQEPPSAEAVSLDLAILQEALAKAADNVVMWEEHCQAMRAVRAHGPLCPFAQSGLAKMIDAHRSALAALHAWRPASAPATPSSDGPIRSLPREPLGSPVVSELTLPVPAFGGTYTIAAPDVCCFPAAPLVAPASAVGPASVDLALAHHTLGSGDSSPSAPPIDSSRRPIGEPAAIVAPIGIVYTPGTAPGPFAAEASLQAKLALEARVAAWAATPVFPLHNAPPA